jgi:hypothetical protein
MRRFCAVMLLMVASGCAGIGASDCAADPFQLGERDGVLGANEVDRHAARCGATFDAGRYREGYAEGFSRRPKPLW